jgi:hypothetical protein
VSHYSRKRRPFVKIGLWILVGMIVLGLLGSTLAWYLGSDSGQQPITETPSSEEDMFTSEIEKQEALREQYEEMLANKPEDLTILTG